MSLVKLRYGWQFDFFLDGFIGKQGFIKNEENAQASYM